MYPPTRSGILSSFFEGIFFKLFPNCQHSSFHISTETYKVQSKY